MAPEITAGRFQGAFLQVLDSIAIRDGELVGSSSEGGIGYISRCFGCPPENGYFCHTDTPRRPGPIRGKELALLQKGDFCKVLRVGAAHGVGFRLQVHVLKEATGQGWISSSTKTGRALVEICSLSELRAAGVSPVVNTVEDTTPSLDQILKGLDRDDTQRAQRAQAQTRRPVKEMEEDVDLDPEEVWRSFTNLARASRKEAEKSEAIPKAAEPYPAFMYIQEPSPEYREEVHERRLRLMAQEKARRSARNRGFAPPQEPVPVLPTRSRPQPQPTAEMPEPVPEYVAPEQTERFAEATFAARVARVARENPSMIGQRQSQVQEVARATGTPFHKSELPSYSFCQAPVWTAACASPVCGRFPFTADLVGTTMTLLAPGWMPPALTSCWPALGLYKCM